MIKISIIMAAYNAKKYISEAIESVLKQTYTNWELVIVDDGSTDNTYDIARTYSDRDDRIIIVRQRNSGTASAARNTALKYVSGNYVQMLDSDDYLSEDCLEKIYKCVLLLNEKECIISPILLSVNDKKEIKGEIGCVSQYIDRTLTGVEGFEYSLDWKIHGCFCVSSDLITRIQYDEEVVNGDEFTTRKLLFNARYVKFIEGIYYYRDNQKSTTKSKVNSSRMYQTLITDGNIYIYTYENKMSEKVQKRCMERWIRNLVSRQSEFNHNINEYTEKEVNFISSILLSEYNRMKEYRMNKSIFGFVYILSFNKYFIFKKMVEIYYIAKKIIK